MIQGAVVLREIRPSNRGELYAVTMGTHAEEARLEARSWRQGGYDARVYCRRPRVDGVIVRLFLVVVRSPRAREQTGAGGQAAPAMDLSVPRRGPNPEWDEGRRSVAPRRSVHGRVDR